MPKVRIVAAVVDTKQLTLYKEDGQTIFIPQRDARLRLILAEITPVISQGFVAEVELDPENAYRKFEEQSGGLVKFFRVAKKRVSSFFGQSDDADYVEPTGMIGSPANYLGSGIEEIMAHASPVSHESFSETETNTDETMIAVIGEGADRKVVPGMENLRGQFEYANNMGSPTGVQNFLKRISAVIDKRQHSIHDLLRFMEKGDLPIADDGSIIIYKILKQSDKEGVYVDCHTRKVTQQVGSYVCMDEALVDPNRRNECSNGLHVARRGYLSSFPGDACFLGKLAPEDVIAVPDYDANKMRVCGYHIIFKIDQEDFATLLKNRPMTDNTAAQRQLGRAISGDHIGKTEEVRITQGHGGGLIVTPLGGDGKPNPRAVKFKMATSIENNAAMAPAVDPKAVAKEVMAAKAAAPAPVVKAPKPNLGIIVAKTGTKQATARDLLKAGNYCGLLVFKKEAKKGWSALGITEAEVAQVMAEPTRFNNPVPKPTPRPKAKAAVKAAPKAAKKRQLKPGPARAAVSVAEPKKQSRSEIARDLFDGGQWTALLAHKKKVKIGWDKFGFSAEEIAEIKLHTGD